MNKYQKSKIYKIVSPHTEKIYVGSTYLTLKKRLKKHKDDLKIKYVSSKKILDLKDYEIILLKNYPCYSREELRKEENKFIEKYKNICVNDVMAYRSPEDKKKYQKQYKIDNKERLSNMKKEKFNCDCGGRYTRYTKKEHESSKKHKYFIETGEQKKEFTKSNKKIKCKCGGEYTEKFQHAHFKSKIHKYFIENGKPFIKPIPKCKSTKLIKCPCGGQYTEKYERGHKRQDNHKRYLNSLI
jgi:predicted GIY-YIG superfamily endonuclease